MAKPTKDPLFGGSTRRGFLGLVGKAGLTAVGAGAALTGTAAPASAAPVCCDLLYPPGNSRYCRGNGSGGFICPTGGHWEAWYCCSGGRTYACAECTTGSSCYAGGIKCSAYWTTNPRGCTAALGAADLEPRMDPADLARWNAAPWGPPVTQAERDRSTPLHLNRSGPTP